MRVFANTRTFNPIKGLYDHKVLKNVHAITASGIGGGSLVYFNITERPESIVYKDWPTEKDGGLSLLQYFDIAEQFIGVNKIATTAGLGKFKLRRTQVFQDAAKAINDKTHNIIDNNGALDLDARLSITDITTSIFDTANGHPTIDDVNKYSIKTNKQNNVCQRQGRCGLGCIPGARHTLNKQLYGAISAGQPIDVFPLCEVFTIEKIDGNRSSDYKYDITFKDYRENITGNGTERTIKAKTVVLAAGTLGSTEILWRSKKLGRLNVSDAVGTHFSTNGDMFGVINPTKEIVDSSRGPMQTSIARFKDGRGNFVFSVEDIGIPKMFAELLAAMFDLMASQKGNSLFSNKNLVDNDGVLDKEATSYNDIFDAFRLALEVFYCYPQK